MPRHVHCQLVIDVVQTANTLLKERLHGKRPRLTDTERVLPARTIKAIGRKALLEPEILPAPDMPMPEADNAPAEGYA